MIYKTLFFFSFILSFIFGILYLVNKNEGLLVLQWIFIFCEIILIVGKGVIGDNFLE